MGRVLRPTRRRARCATACALALGSLVIGAQANAQSWEASLDLRGVYSDAKASFIDGGVEPVRYGSDRSGLELGRLRLAASAPLGQVLELRLDASAWGDHDRNPIDLTEAYLEYRPYPFAGWRARVKAGAFYAPISLENRAAGWESPYTLSFSALDSWVAEELRTIGIGTQIEWLGTRLGHDFDVAITGAAFGWNEPAGVSLAVHGFALDDRQTTLFGRVGRYGGEPVQGYRLFHEIDGRVGEYAGLDVRYLDRLTFRVLRYDNHADPSAFDAVLGEHAWATRFTTAGARAEAPGGWALIAQWMQGATYVAPAGVGKLGWDFATRYFLVSHRAGAHTLSLRYDLFEVDPEASVARGAQDGHAVTVAYAFEPREHWRLMLEWLRVRSVDSNRLNYFGRDPFATDSVLQLSVRYSLGSP